MFKKEGGKMENVELILSFVGTALSLAAMCAVFIIKLIKAVSAKKRTQESAMLLDAVIPLMEIAEKFANYSGEEKREYVLTKINQFALENGLHFNAETVSAKIEELIKLTKKIN